MKITEITKKIIAVFLVTALMVSGPLANFGKYASASGDDAASEDSKLYVKEVKLGIGYELKDAVMGLQNEGYSILQKDGEPVDLNAKSTSKSNQKAVALGYKTTTDPNEGITDLAVMNMKGGYNFSDYEYLLKKTMETKIKPFVEEFIDTIEEYRSNYKKSKNSINYKRANMVRKILNKFTDDDTGGAPIGDLLLNKTKYELGDKAYEALSDEEKKKHMDIVTLLMQGNMTGITMMEKLLVRAADSSTSTWIDRLEETGYDKLIEEFEDKYPDADKNEILKKMDKKYNDTAKALLTYWDDFALIADDYEDKQDELINNAEESTERFEEAYEGDLTEMDDEEFVETINEMDDVQTETIDQAEEVIAVKVSEALNERENDDGNLREFFAQPSDNFKGDEIRKLYPMVASLSDGQIAGIDFLTLQELVDAGLNNIKDLDEEQIKAVEKVSIYDGVNREVYEPGAVAMTNDALRLDALEKDNDVSSFTVMRYVGTAIFVITAVGGSYGLMKGLEPINRKIESLTERAEYFASRAEEALKLEKAHKIDFMYYNDGVYYSSSADYATASANKFSAARLWKALKITVTMAVVLVAITGLVLSIVGFVEEHKAVDYSPIPKYIVDETDITRINEKGEKEFYRNETAYYQVVDCIRYGISENDDITNKRIGEIGDHGDLNGYDGKQWLALYAVKYEKSTPILADSLLVMTGDGSSNVPDGYTTGIHMFGEKNAYNLQNKKLLREEPDDLRIYFKQDKEVWKPAEDSGVPKEDKTTKIEDTGSLVSGSTDFMYLVIAFAAGGILAWVCTVILGRRKKSATPAK